MTETPALKSSLFTDAPVTHGFFSRKGGVSRGIYASLNCGFGSGDDRQAIAENRARVAQAIGVDPSSLVTAYQIHSAAAVFVDRPWSLSLAPKADAMATRTPGVALAILTADCLPALFVDAEEGVIGAAHAGWRGARGGVLEACVNSMIGLGAKPESIRAAFGPCIRQGSFEVGVELLRKFTEQDPDAERFFAPGRGPDKRQLDLAGYAAERVRKIGVVQIDDCGACTYSTSICEIDDDGAETVEQAEIYFSHRRATHRQDPDCGRNVSAIALGAA